MWLLLHFLTFNLFLLLAKFILGSTFITFQDFLKFTYLFETAIISSLISSRDTSLDDDWCLSSFCLGSIVNLPSNWITDTLLVNRLLNVFLKSVRSLRNPKIAIQQVVPWSIHLQISFHEWWKHQLNILIIISKLHRLLFTCRIIWFVSYWVLMIACKILWFLFCKN